MDLPFLTSALDGRELSTSRPGRFIPGTDWIGGWVGSQSRSDAVEYKKNLAPAGNQTPAVPPIYSGSFTLLQ
jgi:hypothetical protein